MSEQLYTQWDVDSQACEKPCHPNSECEICAEYWHRMRQEKFWIDGKGWTNKAFKEMVK